METSEVGRQISGSAPELSTFSLLRQTDLEFSGVLEKLSLCGERAEPEAHKARKNIYMRSVMCIYERRAVADILKGLSLE